MGLFDLQPTVTLYALTNTYFEGEAGAQPQAKRGHSKEKRGDCPLLTLGLMLDASGFVRRSQVFGQRPNTAPWPASGGRRPAPWHHRGRSGGCATLPLSGVSRERHRQFDAEPPWRPTQSNHTVHLHKVSTDPGEVRLYCYSKSGPTRSGPSLSEPTRPR